MINRITFYKKRVRLCLRLSKENRYIKAKIQTKYLLGFDLFTFGIVSIDNIVDIRQKIEVLIARF